MLATSSDTELWKAAVLGDRDAFGQVFKLHYSLLYQYGSKICQDSSVLEDCIQELFLELWQKKPSQDLQSVKAYLLKALKFKLYKSFRDTKITRALEADNVEVFELSHETFLTKTQDDEERTKKLLAAINELPPRQKEIIYLKIYKGLSYEEVSEVMQINYQVVRNLLCQALKTFRKHFVP